MNTMNLPGFTAEESISKKGDHYKFADVHISGDQQVIIPQMMSRWKCKRCFCSDGGCDCVDCEG